MCLIIWGEYILFTNEVREVEGGMVTSLTPALQVTGKNQRHELL